MRGGSPLGGHFPILLPPEPQAGTRLCSPSAWGRADAFTQVLGANQTAQEYWQLCAESVPAPPYY